MFQGDEMGLVNYDFTSMDEITDVEAKGKYAELLEKGKTPEEAFKIVAGGTREHTRILLPWNEFPEGTREGLIQKARPEVTKLYKRLIVLRHTEKALVYGDFTVLNRKKDRFVYKRTLDGTEFVVDCNLGSTVKKAWDAAGYELVEPETVKDAGCLQAYEARVYKKR